MKGGDLRLKWYQEENCVAISGKGVLGTEITWCKGWSKNEPGMYKAESN